MKTGQIIKVLRTNKGIKAKDVYDKVLSRSMYYKYESGLVETTADTFVRILGRLNVNVNEFSRYFNMMDNYNRLAEISKKAQQAFERGDHTTLTATLAELRADYEEDPSLSIAHQEAYVQAALMKLSNASGQNVAKFREHLQVAIRYLKRVEHWGYYEYMLLEQFAPLLTPLSIYKLCKSRNFEMDANPATFEVISSSIGQVINSLLRVQKVEQADEILTEYLCMQPDANHYVAKQRQEFYRGVQMILHKQTDGSEIDGVIHATKAIEALRMVDAHDVADRLATNISTIMHGALKLK